MGEQQSDHIKFRCQCEAKLKVPKSAIGKRVACPKCGFKMTVPGGPAPAAPMSASPPPLPVEKKRQPEGLPALAPDKEEDSLLDDLMQLEQSAEATQQASFADKQKECPKCKVQLAASAQTCLACGYDLNAPKKTKTKSASSASVGAKAVAGNLAKSTGRFALGCCLSFVGAALGAVVWTIIAVVTQYEIGYVAIGIGALAGFGMVIGYNDQNAQGGIMAAIISGVGIVLGKIGIVAFVIGSAIASEFGVELQRGMLPAEMANEVVESRNDIPDHEYDLVWEEEYENAEAEVKKMSDAEVETRYAKYDGVASVFDLDLSEDQYRLAQHRAELESINRGLYPSSRLRYRILLEKNEEVKELSNSELQEALAELDEWEKAGRWSSPEYVTQYLAINRADEAMENSSEPVDYRNYSLANESAKWRKHYDSALTELKEESPEDQVDEAKGIAAEIAREEAEYAAEYGDEDDEDVITEDEAKEMAKGFVADFFEYAFSPIDGLFLILAFGAAYKIAAGGE